MLRNGSSDENSRAEASIRQEAVASGNSDGATISPVPAVAFDDAKMASLIEDEMIPHLIAAHRISGGARQSGLASVQGSMVSELAPDLIADTALDRQPGALMHMIEQALAGGLTPEALLVDVLAPAARCLGSRWDNDSADFIDVTMGLWRMQEIVHELAARRTEALDSNLADACERAGRHILFAVAPGDTHSFGSVMLEDVFQRAGWSTRSNRDGDLADLRAIAGANWFEIIALTISVQQNSAAIADLVAALRQSSRNPYVRIMVGGKIFNDRPELAKDVGADATAEDARAALRKADLLFEQAHIENLVSHASGFRSPSVRALRRSAPG